MGRDESLPPARCPFPGCAGIYDECKRLLVCPDCDRAYFGRVSIPEGATKPEVRERWNGLIVSCYPGEGWAHPVKEGCILTRDEWVKPITWADYEVAVELERTFWLRQDGSPYTEDLAVLRALPTT